MDTVFLEERYQRRKSAFLIHLVDEYGLLRIHNQFTGLFLSGPFLPDENIDGKLGIDQVKSHDVVLQVVQGNIRQVEFDDRSKKVCELSKEL
jgi:hypothetical protein